MDDPLYNSLEYVKMYSCKINQYTCIKHKDVGLVSYRYLSISPVSSHSLFSKLNTIYEEATEPLSDCVLRPLLKNIKTDLESKPATTKTPQDIFYTYIVFIVFLSFFQVVPPFP